MPQGLQDMLTGRSFTADAGGGTRSLASLLSRTDSSNRIESRDDAASFRDALEKAKPQKPKEDDRSSDTGRSDPIDSKSTKTKSKRPDPAKRADDDGDASDQATVTSDAKQDTSAHDATPARDTSDSDDQTKDDSATEVDGKEKKDSAEVSDAAKAAASTDPATSQAEAAAVQQQQATPQSPQATEPAQKNPAAKPLKVAGIAKADDPSQASNAEQAGDESPTPTADAELANTLASDGQPKPAKSAKGDASAGADAPKAVTTDEKSPKLGERVVKSEAQDASAANAAAATVASAEGAGAGSASDESEASSSKSSAPGHVAAIDPSATAAATTVASDASAAKPADFSLRPAATNAAPAPQSAPNEADFAQANHQSIVSNIRGELLPGGGTMHIRLDPPELGVLQVTVKMVDGSMTASFETSNDQATKLLSHSLGQLKTALETQGVNVEKLHVQQSPKDQQADSNREDGQSKQSPQEQQQSARQEQQRREMLRRMWRRLGVGSDPLDLVA